MKIFLMNALKNLFRIACFGLLALFLVSASNHNSNVEGVWSYEASGTPYEYSKGEITIKQVDNAHEVVVSVNYSNLKGDNVNVDGGKVKFNLYVEDLKVEVELNIEGDKLTGQAKSYEGNFALKGQRK